MLAQCRRESNGHWDVTQTPAFWGGNVTSPIRPLNTQLTLGEIDVGPLKPDHFATAH